MPTLEAQVAEQFPCVEWDSCRTGHLAACPAFYRPMALAFAKRVRREAIEAAATQCDNWLGDCVAAQLAVNIRALLNEKPSNDE